MTHTDRRLVFGDPRPMGGPLVDLSVVDGVIAAKPLAPDQADEAVDCGGLMALPSLVDAHIHPDKTAQGAAWFTRKPVSRGLPDYVELYHRLETPMAERARRLMPHLLALCTGARLDEDLGDCYLVAAHRGADVLGLPCADFTPGSPADLLLVDGECLPQVVADKPLWRMVVRAGRVIARNGELIDDE